MKPLLLGSAFFASLVVAFAATTSHIQSGESYETPALIVDQDGHWTLASKGFRSATRFFRSRDFGVAYEDALIVNEAGFGVGFSDPEGPSMRAVRREYQIIGNYMIVAPVDRETTMMIGRKNDVEMDWDEGCILAELGTMQARSCFDDVTITWPDNTPGFMTLDQWLAFAQGLCAGGAYVVVEGACPSSTEPFSVTLYPISNERSFRQLKLSSADGASELVLSHNIRPVDAEPDKFHAFRRKPDGSLHEFTEAEKLDLIKALESR